MEEIKDSYDQKGELYKHLTFHPTKKYCQIYTALKHLKNDNNSLEGLCILEIACGGGLLMLEALLQGSHHITGLDISQTMLNSASQVLQTIDSSKYSLKCGDCTDPHTMSSLFFNQKFDAIVAT